MKKFVFVFLLSFILLPGFVFSAGEITNDPVNTTPTNKNTIKWTLTNPLKRSVGGDSIADIIASILKYIISPLASMLVVLAILYSGFKFVIAQGKPAEIQQARDGLLWVLVGALILLGSYGISEALKNTVNSIVDF
ncbi:MAG: hypothetical protein ACYCZW_03195 [Minisyncoccota bacterium]